MANTRTSATKYFSDVKNFKDLREKYVFFAKALHPDNGGNAEEFKRMNNEYADIFSYWKARQAMEPENNNDGNEKQGFNCSVEMDAKMREQVLKVIHFPDIKIEMCGTWVWVSGNTYDLRKELKEAGYKFSHNKQSWYWHDGKFRKKGKRDLSMNEIRDMFGGIDIDNEPSPALN